MNLKNLPAGENAPDEVNVVIEIPQGGNVKYEIDPDTGTLTVDRLLYTAMQYPTNYGFIPSTLCDDGDPVDVLVYSSRSIQPGAIITTRPIAMLEMEDEAGIDTKIVAVPTAKIDPFLSHISDVNDLPDILKDQIKHFFQHMKELEPGKWVKLKSWKSKEEALEVIRKSLK